jgi:hypothetical protein
LGRGDSITRNIFYVPIPQSPKANKTAIIGFWLLRCFQVPHKGLQSMFLYPFGPDNDPRPCERRPMLLFLFPANRGRLSVLFGASAGDCFRRLIFAGILAANAGHRRQMTA